MAERRIDTLLVELIFRGDTKGLENVNRKLRDMDRQVQAVVRGAKVAVTAAIGIGTAAFFTGSKTEREFAKFQTQLGDTEEQVEALKPQLRALSKETGQSFESLAAAAFNLKSSVQGISDEKAFEVITAAAKGATIEIGNVDDLALLAGLGIRTFGEDVISGQKALDILHATIRSGTIPDTRALASGFGRLLTPGKELDLTFEELGAVVAGYSPTGPISEVINAIRATLIQLFAPTTEALPILKNVFGGAENAVALLHERLRRDGLLKTLAFLRSEIGEDTVSFRKLLGSVEAVSFVIDATGNNMGKYTAALEANRDALGSVNAGLEIYKNTGAFQAQIATNNLRLALDSFYNAAVVPLLQAFGKLPSLIQTVVLGLTTMSAASLVLGGPSLGTLIGSLGRFIVALKTGTIWQSKFVVSLKASKVAQLAGAAATVIASAATWAFNAALLANPLTWIVLGIVGLIAALVLLVKHWDTVKRVVRDFFDRYGNYVLAALAVVAPFIAVPLLIAKNWSRIVEIVGGIWSRVNDTVRGWIEAIIDFVSELPSRVVGILKDIPGMVADAIRDIPGLGAALEVFTRIAGKVGKVFTGAEGGIVPGPLGRPVPAIVHGGEMVLPVGASRVIAQMLEGFRLGPAALPQAPHYYGQMYRSSVDNRSVTVNITEPIVIQTQATDAKGIAQEIGEAIQDQIRNIAYDHDGPVER